MDDEPDRVVFGGSLAGNRQMEGVENVPLKEAIRVVWAAADRAFAPEEIRALIVIVGHAFAATNSGE
jgi:hypothetical protein